MFDRSSNTNKKKKAVTVKHLKNWTLTLVGLCVIFLAISFTLVRVAIKSIPDYSIAIQQAVSEQLDMTLDVGFIDAEIYWLVPRLNLFDVNISDDEGKHHFVHLDEVDLSLDWAESIRTMSPVVGEITLSGLSLQIGINKKSELIVQNYVVNENIDEALKSENISKHTNGIEISDALKNYFNNLNFKILDSQIQYYDERNRSKSKTFSNLSLHLINSGSSHVFEVKADLPHKYGRYAHFIIDVNGDLFDYKNLDGELYLALENIKAASWIDDYWNEINFTADADVNGRFWLTWSGEDIVEVSGRIGITDLGLHYLDDKVKTWNVDQIEARVRWSQEYDDWQLDVRDLIVERKGIDWLKPAAATLSVKNSEKLVKLQADFLRIEGFVYLAGMVKSAINMDVAWLNLLEQFKPSGQLENLDVEVPLEQLHDIRINTKFSQLGFHSPGSEPSEVKNLQGSVAYLDRNTWLILDSQNTKIEFNDLFRNSIVLEKLKGSIKLSHEDNLWRLSANSLTINAPEIQAKVRVDFNMPDGGQPFVDLTARYKNGSAKAVAKYLPAGVMGKDTVAWIDRALLKGKVIDGGYQFYGFLKDAPFRGNEGVSLADFNVGGVDLSYLENWPDVKNISANLRFVNDTMFIRAHQGTVFNSNVKNATVYIDNFISPTLDLKGDIEVDLIDLKKFIDESSLREDVTDYIENLEFKGSGNLNLQLFLPLYGDYNTEVGGRLLINNGGLYFKKENYELTDINGEIRFAGDTVESNGLSAKILNGVADKLLDISIKTENKKDLLIYHANVNGEMYASSLVASLPEIKPYFKGSSIWDIAVDITNNKLAEKSTVRASLSSDLQGVVTALPGPLAKHTVDAAPVRVDVNVVPGEYINYKLILQNKDSVVLKQTDSHILINADASSVKGSVDINVIEGIDVPVEIDLDYFNVSQFFNSESKKSPESEKSGNTSIGDASIEDASIEDISSGSISPRNIPSFNLQVKKLVWKQAEYGDSSLKIQKSRLGSVIDSFRFAGADHVITGRGSWFTGKNDISETKLDVNIQVNDLGAVFKELEISDSLFATSGNIKLNWSWQDVPYKFDWKKLQGDGQLNLKDGVMKEFNAGAGRILGLFNFKTLLSLDFGSQMEDGFSFDKVNGSFSFSNENIYSDDFEIESKVATIFMKGKLSIANNLIDQTVTVRPHLGGTVTLGTTVLAGPAVGGLVYLFQKIFNTDRLSEYQYTVKGPIDNPDATLLSVPVTADEEEDGDF